MRLIRMTTIVWLAMAALIGGTVLYGRSQPASNLLRVFGWCNGQPCYQGIVLKTTTWEDAKRILSSTPGFTLSSLVRGAEVSSGPVRMVQVYPDAGGTIFEVDLGFRQATLMIGNVLEDLGPPCAVYPLPLNSDLRYPYTVILAYPTMSVYVTTNNVGWRVEPASFVSFIDLGDVFLLDYANQSDNPTVDRCRGSKDAAGFDWKGLRSYPHP